MASSIEILTRQHNINNQLENIRDIIIILHFYLLVILGLIIYILCRIWARRNINIYIEFIFFLKKKFQYYIFIMGATSSSENIEEVENAVKQNRYLMLKQIRESEIKL